MTQQASLLPLVLGIAAILTTLPAQSEPGAQIAAGKAPLPIATFTAGLQRADGLLPFYYAPRTGKLFVRIAQFDRDLLYVNSLPAGVGSNDIGLDRGKLGANSVVQFRRTGSKVVLVAPNLSHRADSDNPEERRAVVEGFAQSVLWGFKIVAEDRDAVLVDATDFLLRDAFGVARSLKQSKQGNFRVDAQRSFISRRHCRAFPRNTELQATLTFTGDDPGAELRQVAPNPRIVTVQQRHSFVELPDDAYRPRRHDPRCGYSPVTWQDYAAPIGKPLIQRFIRRHRLVKKNPGPGPSEVVEPIVYYLDPGAPEPVRSALLDGARWWAEAFEAAGFKDAYRVEILPDGADPMDVRYNVIQWVHRSSRGWSYGSSVTDPRTGEILKGHVSLGSRRVRQDYLIAQALVGNDPKACEKMALARLRQLAAHEVGHTLGLAHNFAASAFGRASVMDYPHPLLRRTAEGVDLSDAYGVGIGAWDTFAIRWGYAEFASGGEAAGLAALVRESQEQGLRFLSDNDARPTGSMHPVAHLWDNGADPIAELDHLLAIRKERIAAFGPELLAPGEPLTRLDELFTPLYLLHRYQVEAVAKLIGGVDYAIAAPGDPKTTSTPVPAAVQTVAIQKLLLTLTADVLSIPEAVTAAIPARTHGSRRRRELLPSASEMAFDPHAAAAAAARHTVRLLLHPARLARFHRQSIAGTATAPPAMGLDALLDNLLYVIVADNTDSRRLALRRVVGDVVVTEVLSLAADPGADGPVRDATIRALSRVVRNAPIPRNGQNRGILRIKTYLERPQDFRRPRTPELPPGSPIGCACGAPHFEP